jgi:DNA repair protein RecO (recombination protein O)
MAGLPADDRAAGIEAVVLRRIPFDKTDLVVHFAAQDVGHVACFARSAKRSRRRFPSGFPSFALLEIHVGPPPRADAMRPVLDALVLRPNAAIASDLPRFAAAGLILELAREVLSEEQPEPQAFDSLAAYLVELDEGPFHWTGLLAAEMRLLAPIGLAPRLDRCLSCDAPAPPRKAAFFDVRRGGIVCRSCGGADRTLAGEPRARMLAALQSPAASSVEPVAAAAPYRDAHRTMLAFLEHHIGRRFRSTRLLEEVAGG